MRAKVRRFLVVLGSCGCAEAEPPTELPETTRLSPAEEALRETLVRANALAREIEDVLRPVPLMRPAEEEALRRYLAPAHLERARRRLGVRAGDAAGIRELPRQGRLVALEDSTEHRVVYRRGNS